MQFRRTPGVRDVPPDFQEKFGTGERRAMKTKALKQICTLLMAVVLMAGLLPVKAHAVSGADVVAVAESLVGQYPYVTGGEDPSEGGFDCSGLVYYVYHTLGHKMTIYEARNRNSLLALGQKITNRADFQPGDVVQFTYDHVAIYAGDNMIVEASKPGTLIRKVSLQYRDGVAYAVRLSFDDAGEHTTHIWDRGVVTKEPTLTEPGVITYTCVVCGETKTEQISASESVTVQYNSGIKLLLTKDGQMSLTGSGVLDYPIKYVSTGALNMSEYLERVISVTVGEGITSIDDGVFWDLPKLETVELPSSLTRIGDAFAYCPALTYLNIPANVSEISPGGFRGCESLNSFSVDGANKWFAAHGGVLYDKAMKKLVACPAAKPWGYTVPEGVTEIAANAFENSALTTLSIPQTLTAVGEDAFKGFKGVLNVFCGSFGERYAAERSIKHVTDQHNWDWGRGVITEAATYDTPGNISFPCSTCDNHLDVTLPVLENDKPLPFTDVEEDAYYYEAVKWAVKRSITNGTSETTFSPDQKCTRAQAVTFLWKASNSPAPRGTENPFSDVYESDYYYKAILWALEQGIVSGDDLFRPSDDCTRGMIVTLLWRSQGSPAAMNIGAFTDVPDGQYYSTAVSWAVLRGITNGKGDGTFAPMDTCTRGQIVTFLNRAIA